MNKATRYVLHFILIAITCIILFLLLGNMTKSFVKEIAKAGQQKSSTPTKITSIITSQIKPKKQPVISDYKDQNKVSKEDKRCNELITKAWSDKSEATLKAKNEACAHNKVN